MDIHPSDWSAMLQWSQFQAGFLARTSHELRSPLSSLMSLHQLVLNDLCDDPEEERNCIRQAYEAANRLLKMLELATQISKLSIGMSHPQREAISIQVLLDEVRSLTALQAANRNITLAIENLPEALQHRIWIESDPGILRQILVCLIDSTLTTLSTGSVMLSCEVVEQGINLNLETDPPLNQWQEALDILTHTPQHFDRLQQEVLNQNLDIANALPLIHQKSYCSYEYNLILSQLLLQYLQAKLLLVESKKFPSSFHLQCHIVTPIFSEHPVHS